MTFKLIDKMFKTPVGDFAEVEDIKEFIQLLKEDWRKKARRMEIMSGEVAIFELENLINKLSGFSDEEARG